MKAGVGNTEELKAANQIKWIGLIDNVRITAKDIVQREIIYVILNGVGKYPTFS